MGKKDVEKIGVLGIEKLKPYAKNAKIHNVASIKKSIDDYGFDQDIVVDEDFIILKGHGRFQAAQELGLEAVPVSIRKGLTEEEKKHIRLIDNKSSIDSYNSVLVFEDVEELSAAGFDLSLSGLDEYVAAVNTSILDSVDDKSAKKEKEKDGGRSYGDRSKKIKIIFYSEESEIIEGAILKTGLKNRIKAIEKIFKTYSDGIL